MSSAPPSEPPGSDDGDRPLPPLDARWLVRVQSLLGAGGVAAGAAIIASGAAVPGAFLLAASGIQFGSALQVGRVARLHQLLGAARDAIELGQLDVAEALLDRAAGYGAAARRSVSVIRAGLQLQRDDPAGAALLASGAIGSDDAPRPPGAVWATTLEALGVRALARAATGDAEGADADASRIRGMLVRGTDVGASALGAGHVIDEARARAALAGAIGLARSGERDALRAHLAENEATLHSATRPRERGVLRGLERMLAAERVSPYRGSGDTERVGDSGEDRIAEDWVATMLPGAARFIPSRDARGAFPLPDLATVSRAAEPGDWSSARRIVLLVATWVAVAAAAFAANFIDYPGLGQGLVLTITMMIPLIFAMGILAFAVGRGFRSVSRRQTLADAIVLAASTGDVRSLVAMTQAPEPILAAQAMLVLARRANLAGEFSTARDLAAEGLLRTSGFLRRAAVHGDLRPALIAELALAHAGAGAADDALAAVESIEEGFLHRARARFGVRLVALAASGDVAGATALAERRPPDLPLDRPIEALADVLRANAAESQIGLAERARITSDLRRCPDLLAWARRIVPRIVDEMDLDPVSGQRVRVTAVAPSATDDEAVNESMADEESAREATRARRRLAR